MKDRGPDDPPAVRPVLYTNEVVALMSALTAGLLYRTPPERLRAALRTIVDNWDPHTGAHPDFLRQRTAGPEVLESTDTSDPEDTPLVRHVLFTSEALDLLFAYCMWASMLSTPARVHAALLQALETFDAKVGAARHFVKVYEIANNEPSGWKEPDGSLN